MASASVTSRKRQQSEAPALASVRKASRRADLSCEPRATAEGEKGGENENAGHPYAGPTSDQATHRAEGQRITRERLMNQRDETDR
jgi:hypothetical protein